LGSIANIPSKATMAVLIVTNSLLAVLDSSDAVGYYDTSAPWPADRSRRVVL